MSTKRTIAGDGEDNGNTRSSAAPWSDLPDDLLGNIRLRIASQLDRARFAAVCKPWRVALARIPAPAAAPLLLSTGWLSDGKKHLCGGGPDDGWWLRMTDEMVGKWLVVGSHDGGWVTAFDFGSLSVVLLNLFSGAKVEVCPPCPDKPWQHDIFHVALSDRPASSSGCIIAAIADQWETIALCKMGCRRGWTTQQWEAKMFTAINFCNGELFGLTYPDENLVRFDIGIEEDGSPVFNSTYQLAIQRRHGPTVEEYPEVYDCYILELHGKPLMATKTRWLPNRDPFFKVFELVDADADIGYQYKWAEVTSFGDYALFLGTVMSKAVHVPVEVERRGFRRNHIYYSSTTSSIDSNLCTHEVYSLRLDNDHIMYCREDQSIGDGLERTGYFVTGWINAPIWIHPPEL